MNLFFRLGGISAGLGRGGGANSQRPNQGCQIENGFYGSYENQFMYDTCHTKILCTINQIINI